MNSLDLWGGYECTVNRVGDEWYDQSRRSGHEHRFADLQLVADLGITSLRYPALWERISPRRPDTRDFRWTDERLGELRRLGINPILTLCHHGSGPHYTSLVEDSFAPGLAKHAAAVAARYPWVRDWTPVNEPLTTARFSALYGLWYPHTQDEGLFWTALLNEIDATRLSMREIRKVNPEARLIQTDDLGYCHATEPLQHEADFQNERRWIGWDLLCGMVVPGHALWEHIAAHGLAGRLKVIAADPCPPDVIGINHYLSSERLMDHRVELYPNRSVADRAVGLVAGIPKIDVDAIRHREEGVLGLPALVEQAWRRYGRTIAITECHNGSTREEQIRWFLEVWEGAEALRSRGVDLCAVTAWALLGSYDWNRMVTRFMGHYETGVYDVRTGTPRPTRLASVLKDLGAGRKPSVPGMAGAAWWRRESRLVHAAPKLEPEYELMSAGEAPAGAKPLLIVCDGSELSRLAVRACEARGLYYMCCDAGLEQIVADARPWAVLDAHDRDAVCRTGIRSSRHAKWSVFGDLCRRHDLPLASVSGVRPWPANGACREKPFALVPKNNVADSTDLANRVLKVRTGPLFVPWDRSAPAVEMLDALDAGRAIEIDSSLAWNDVYGPDVMDAVLDLLFDDASGVVDALPSEGVTQLAFARALAAVADVDPGLVRASSNSSSAPSSAWSGPASYLPPLESSLERFVRECRVARIAGEFAMERHDDDVRMMAAE
jgi:dTDP-4-dehydrorhamnose reductase